MMRLAIVSLVVTAAILALAGDAVAQATPSSDPAETAIAASSAGQWAPIPIDKPDWRGPGYYLSLWKMAIWWGLVLLWVATSDWVNRDLQAHSTHDILVWNPMVIGPFFLALLLSWVVPVFWMGLAVMVLAYATPLCIFVLQRNERLPPHEQVMTREHLRYWGATKLNKLGLKIAVEEKDKHETGPAVKVFPAGGPTEREETARLGLARQSSGLTDARVILNAGLQANATAIMLDYSQQAVSVRYLVDGLWIDRDPTVRETADPALESLKILTGCNPQERAQRQEGEFAVEFNGDRYKATLGCQGTPTGERVLVQFERKSVSFKTLADTGMREKTVEEFGELINREKGFVLLSAMQANGLRTTTTLTLRTADRLMRDFAAVDEVNSQYELVENVPVTTYDAGTGQTPATVLSRLIRAEPQALVVRDLVNKETIELLCRWVRDEGRLVFSTVRAKDCAEALLRVLALGVPANEWANTVTVVLNQRLVRKLCDCKEAFTPTPEMLKQLGIPAGRVQTFFRPPTPNSEERVGICDLCGGIGYRGRTAITEMLVVGENVRKVLTTAPRLDQLRAAARKDGMRSLQEEGVLLVAKGVTSLPELMRVMRQ